LPLLHIRQHPDASVTLLPSDHFVFEEAQCMAAVETAAACVMAYPSHLMLLGVEPTYLSPGPSRCGS
jgi:mannose-1-phosphate guanylyltransferase